MSPFYSVRAQRWFQSAEDVYFRAHRLLSHQLRTLKVTGKFAEVLMRPVLLALALLAPSLANAQVLEPREIAQRGRMSLVGITAYRGQEVLGTGSGFIVSADGQIVTNRHVIEGATSLAIQLADGDVYDRVFVVSDDTRRDLALLRIPATRLPTLPFGNDRAAQAGDRVYVIGNPKGLEGSFSDGMVSAVRTVDGTTFIQITAPISPGSSGGPVMNSRGEVIGVATLYLEGGQNLNMAVAGRYARGLLSLGETPRPFEDVASRFARSSSYPSSRSTNASAADEEEYPEWAWVLVDEMLAVAKPIEEAGYRQIFEPEFGGLKTGYYEELEYDLTRIGQSLVAAAVCDGDCSRLEIAIYNSAGVRQNVASRGRADRPQLWAVVHRADTYVVRVVMRECSSEPCYYALQIYGK